MSVNLAQALVDFKEDVVLGEVDRRLGEGENPISIIRDLQEGMRMIGDKFNSGEFFLSELLMSADVFTKAMNILEPKLEGQSMEMIGKMVKDICWNNAVKYFGIDIPRDSE